jgi:N6-adenosine-specific RNA methylase IME4
MRGAAQAGVVGADRHFDVVEQAFGDRAAVEIFARHRAHGLVHGLVVVRGADDQVAHRDQVVVAHA